MKTKNYDLTRGYFGEEWRCEDEMEAKLLERAEEREEELEFTADRAYNKEWEIFG